MLNKPPDSLFASNVFIDIFLFLQLKTEIKTKQSRIMKKTTVKLLGAMTLLLGMAIMVHGQTATEAINLYNNAAKVANTDTKAAIADFLKVLDMCGRINDTAAAKVCELATSQLPALQFNYASELYKSSQLDSSIANFEKAYTYAQIYGDEKTEGKTADILSKLYLSLGNNYYRDDDFTNAMTVLNKSLKYNPKFAKVYLTMGMIYKKQDNAAMMTNAMDTAILYGNEENDPRTVGSAQKVMKDYFLISANGLVKDKDYNQMITLLDKAQSYDKTDANIYYLYALAYNGLSEWDKALEAATTGLGLEAQDNAAKAKFYFEMGNAYYGKNETDKACTAYKNAMYGNFVEQAKYQIETVLKCN